MARLKRLFNSNNAFAPLDFPDQPGLKPLLSNVLQDLLGDLRRYDDRHTNAHVEHLVKLSLRHASFRLEQTEYRWNFPGTLADEDVTILRQHARNIVHETPAGDMGQSLDT